MLDELRRVAMVSSGVAELTRHQAEQIVRDFVKRGDVRRQQASDAVKDLIESSRQGRRELVRFVAAEVQNQVESLGLVTRRDIERIERRISRLEQQGGGGSSSRAKTTRKKKTTAKKTSSRKTSAKSSANKTGSTSSS